MRLAAATFHTAEAQTEVTACHCVLTHSPHCLSDLAKARERVCVCVLFNSREAIDFQRSAELVRQQSIGVVTRTQLTGVGVHGRWQTAV